MAMASCASGDANRLVDASTDSGSGAPCTTGNPGLCSGDHRDSGGNCLPDQTTQPCYSGPMNTAGVGICKAGSQSCIGTLGPCENQVVPAAQEDCFNDLDDDCDG